MELRGNKIQTKELDKLNKMVNKLRKEIRDIEEKTRKRTGNNKELEIRIKKEEATMLWNATMHFAKLGKKKVFSAVRK